LSLKELKQGGFRGEISDSSAYRMMYATDASIYREFPTAVVLPANTSDIQLLVDYASKEDITIIPRAAGTSLAGQCVGDGIIMDCSHMNQILAFDKKSGIIELEPGVIRDELNSKIKGSGYFFGPNTSTSNRCMLGGMVGNNSSGTTSVQFGVTRDKVLEIDMVMSDGSLVCFAACDEKLWKEKTKLASQEGILYKQIDDLLSDITIQEAVKKNYPRHSIHRRNSAYAIDELMKFKLFGGKEEQINLCRIICGSEGTFGVITRIKIQLDKLPPESVSLLMLQFDSIDAALRCVPAIMQHNVYSCELMDRTILDCASRSKSQSENIKLIKGEPEAVLMVELRDYNSEGLGIQEQDFITTIKNHYQDLKIDILYPPDIEKAWKLRAAGLGILSNIPGDSNAVACIEDTAVDISELADYISDFAEILNSFGQEAVYYAHAGAGEIHLRPILNFKTEEGIQMFKDLTRRVAELVKNYNGSLSGEHGDGRLRAPYLESFYGAKLYDVFRMVKVAFDPQGIFNKGKIIDPKPIDADLRFQHGDHDIASFYDYNTDQSILGHLERCNGSGDCRASHTPGVGMCPTYHVSKKELYTTRGRANIMREVVTAKSDDFLSDEYVTEAMGTCIACKACVSDCPSGIDMARIKSEFLYRKKVSKGLRLRDRMFTESDRYFGLIKYLPWKKQLFNSGFAKLIFSQLGISPKRSIPLPASRSLSSTLQLRANGKGSSRQRSLILFVDEFMDAYDIEVGIAVYDLMWRLGYDITLFTGHNSGRAHISRGLLDRARALACRNVDDLFELIKGDVVLIGIEPSAMLSFRDEYSRMLDQERLNKLKTINKNCFLIEEFLLEEIELGNLTQNDFKSTEKWNILYHGHCHQKVLSDVTKALQLLNFPDGLSASLIDSGCCGMAGSFGYEAEHYDLSMQIAEQRLFKAIRARPEGTLICASGLSCRHQIKDGLNLRAYHPAEVLLKALG
jgi:FAD/FMN-containing dehydrogenase/Fe-S oxidoreductase